MANEKRCTHQGCSCAVPQERKDSYCSDYCARNTGQAGGHKAHGCGCGHPSCKH